MQMRDHSLAGPGTEPATPSSLAIPELVEGIEVVEWPERQQRKLDELRRHIDDLLDDGWMIASRNPLTLQQGSRLCYVLHGMLVSDALI
tara:strand:- start:194 stop:460 length:267 start_codon:yes stop_codon:yes gene_type:complete